MQEQIKIIRLETEMKAIKEDIAQSRVEISEIKQELQRGFEKIEAKMNCYVRKDNYTRDSQLMDNRLKMLERIIYGLVSTVLLAIIGAIISSVLK